ncbi:MAG: carbohydrate ABC transporter permease [Thermomicrobiales bacterium]
MSNSTAVTAATLPPAAVRRGRDRRQSGSLIATILAFAVAALFAIPYLYMLLSSFKTPVDNIAMPPKLFFDPTLDNFHAIFENDQLLLFLRNTLVVATLSTLVAMILAVPAAYGLVRFPLRRREGIAYLFLVIQLVPVIAVVFPYFDIARRLHLYDTVWILIIVYTLWNIPWGIWLVRGFIQDVPRELEESSMVDGSSRIGAMTRITLPLAAPGLTAASILLFIGAWNEFTLAFFLTTRVARTYPTSIGFFLTHSGIRWGEMFATALIGTLPVVIFAILVRKTFISSLSFGAVKG